MAPDLNHTVTLDLHSTRDSVRRATEMLSQTLAALDLPEDMVFDVKLAVQEAVINAVEHGNRCDPAKFVHVCCRMTDDAIAVTIADEGDGFDPDALPDPTLPENILKENGRGVFLMRNLCDEVRFNEKGNEVTIVKRIPH